MLYGDDRINKACRASYPCADYNVLRRRNNKEINIMTAGCEVTGGKVYLKRVHWEGPAEVFGDSRWQLGLAHSYQPPQPAPRQQEVSADSSGFIRGYQSFPLAAKIKCFRVFLMRTRGRIFSQVPDLARMLLSNWFLFISQALWIISRVMFHSLQWSQKAWAQVRYVTASSKYTNPHGTNSVPQTPPSLYYFFFLYYFPFL